ncbi:DUF262 domain-containing protein [Methylobacterium sp. Leaf469]|uniref:DUF262 domain-containing protein n=1 Tax=Methylobacterium sp. Leaf469 TaxID=1736387 RepID=UPI000ADD0416|nr:DUF262 domain-containing protein [Methylobacterium sp. Leaf469]
MSDRLFDGTSVQGLNLLSFLDWARSSNAVLRTGLGGGGPADGDTDESLRHFGLLALPPVQRSAVWRPKQVVDLWDSLLRGLPIGSFFLMARGLDDVAHGRDFGSDGRIAPITRAGFDLFDGQQRTRAMLLGVCGPDLDRRCLWMDLAPGAKHRLHLTSASQPFGYEPSTGQKLSRSDRAKARANFDGGVALTVAPGGAGEPRAAYDHEVFDLILAEPDGQRDLPRPYKASGCTYRLDELLAAWRAAHVSTGTGADGLARLIAARAPGEDTRPALAELATAFERVADGEVALMHIDPSRFAGGGEAAHESLLMLFDRIGAGGTPLTNDERLFSILKHHDPRVHNAVLEIHAAVGRVMAPTKIVVTALRIANALSSAGATGIPDVAGFARTMSERAPETAPFRDALSQLIPTKGEAARSADSALLTQAFRAAFTLLEYEPVSDSFATGSNQNGLPRAALVELPTELWQVVLFWAVRGLRAGRTVADLGAARGDLLRFALFWRLCVYNDGRAAAWSLKVLQEHQQTCEFPGRHLYRLCVGDVDGERCANRLLAADVMTRFLVADPPVPVWRSAQERFARDEAPVGYEALASAWWWSARKMLPWLQRDYVASAFPHYDPLSDRDDDLPYDLDHLCPQADWGANWNGLSGRIEASAGIARAMWAWRSLLGNGIGNMRIVDASVNRGDGDAPLPAKVPGLADTPLTAKTTGAMAAMALDPTERALWLAASTPDDRWDEARLAAFQSAVERRSAALYHRYFEELEFTVWLLGDEVEQNV